MTENILVISGSTRAGSNTTLLVEHLFGKDVNHIELCKSHIAQYDYDDNYAVEDGFQNIVNQMLLSDLIILATPVYWYTMSGYTKVFLDRWTDLVTTCKDKGRALKGKRLAVIAQSTSEAMPQGFELPIKLTAEYMDMKYVGEVFWDMRRDLDQSQKLQLAINQWTNG